MEDDKLRQIRETYRNLLDRELLSLAADSNSLTDVGRSVLKEEMTRRGLDVEFGGKATIPSDARQKVHRRIMPSGTPSLIEKYGWLVAIVLFGLIRIAASSHRFPQGGLQAATGILLLLMVSLAIFELIRIRKRERRRKHLAVAIGKHHTK